MLGGHYDEFSFSMDDMWRGGVIVLLNKLLLLIR
jgi:hypothetical protein